MPVPASFADLSATIASNSPSGTDTVFPNLDDYLRAQSGLIRQLYDGDSMRYTPSGSGAVVTTAQTKLRESVSVKDFGATGDGVTDDTAAIQAAINAAQTSKKLRVYFPSGKYIASTITLYSGMSIYGDGQGSFGGGTTDTTNGYGTTYWATVLQQKSSTNAHFIRFIALNEGTAYDYIGPVSIHSMCIKGGVNTSGDAIRFQSASNFGHATNLASPRPTILQALTVLRDLLIIGFPGNGIWLPAPHAGVQVDNVYAGFCGGAGIYLDSGGLGTTACQLNNITGDANLGGQIVIYGLGQSGTSPTDGIDNTVVITNLHAERRINFFSFAGSAQGNINAIILDTCNTGTVIVNGVLHYSITSTKPGDTILIRNQSANFAPSVVASGVINQVKTSYGQTAPAGNVLNDTVNSKTVPAPVAMFSYGRNYSTIAVDAVSTSKPWVVAGQLSAVTAAVPSGGFQAVGATPSYIWSENDQILDQKTWAMIASGGSLTLRLLDDAGNSVTTMFNISRTGSAANLVDFPQPTRVSNVSFNLTALGVYANEAAAASAGLTTGRVYQTATGELRVKL